MPQTPTKLINFLSIAPIRPYKTIQKFLALLILHYHHIKNLPTQIENI